MQEDKFKDHDLPQGIVLSHTAIAHKNHQDVLFPSQTQKAVQSSL